MGEDEKELLTKIAYCAEGMFDCENNMNLGDAKDWKRQLRIATDAYYDFCIPETVIDRRNQPNTGGYEMFTINPEVEINAAFQFKFDDKEEAIKAAEALAKEHNVVVTVMKAVARISLNITVDWL